jgi:hypothetical protein
MQERDELDVDTCWDCGAEIEETRGRGFLFGDDGILCAACAARRGGSYDEAHDRWTREPDTSDLVRSR